MKIAIVGAGSSGLMAAFKLSESSNISVDIFEKGNGFESRSRADVLSGFGGAGAFSDGKLTLTTEFGGWLTEYVDERVLAELIDYVDDVWRELSGVNEIDSNWDYEKIKDLEYLCSRYKLRLYPAKIRHLGTDNCVAAIKKFYEIFHKKTNVDIFCNCEIVDLYIENGRVLGVITKQGEKMYYDRVILAVGRSGNPWISELVKRYDMEFDINPVDIGVRVEVPQSVTDYFTNFLYEFKIKYFTSQFEDEVRTFCVNPGGFIAVEKNDGGITTVNGHSYKNRKSRNTNFALLVSTKFTEPFKEPVKYGQYIANLANMLGGGTVILQRFGDLTRGRRSTLKRIEKNFVSPTLVDALPGDLSFVIPYRYLSDIIETIYQMDKIMPGIADPTTLLYGVEVKFYSLRMKVDERMRSKNLENLYCVGDGAGLTRGIIQASASGVLAARDIVSNN
jgi:uncharacterized FAD-dependent dehydrogenase